MKKKITVSLDTELVAFLDSQGEGNRSDYLNCLLTRQRSAQLEAEMITALAQDMEDREYQAEIAAWDCVVGDGIDALG